jgi:hypothetical protein
MRVSFFAWVAAATALSRFAGAVPPPSGPPPNYGQPPPGVPTVPPPTYGEPGPASETPPPLYDPSVRSPAAPPPASAPPPPTLPAEPMLPVPHAPAYALWIGPRVSFIAYGLSFYRNERGDAETTGNYLGNGFGPQIDLGARLAQRYIPYVFFERGFMAQGRRYEGTNASSTTDFFGVGFRYLSGDVDTLAFVTDVSIGKRVVRVSDGDRSYSMSGIEFFRLGLGAEVRISTLLAVTPVFTVSSGSFSDTSGDLPFSCAPNCEGGVNGPTFKNGRTIDDSKAYVVLSLGVGAHFDLFGK